MLLLCRADGVLGELSTIVASVLSRSFFTEYDIGVRIQRRKGYELRCIGGHL